MAVPQRGELSGGLAREKREARARRPWAAALEAAIVSSMRPSFTASRKLPLVAEERDGVVAANESTAR